jgi:uncharacterized protein
LETATVLLVLAVAFGAFAQGATGIGFTLVAAPACALALDASDVIGTVARLAVVVDVALVAGGVRHVDVRVAARYLWFALPAVPIAVVVASVVAAEVLVVAAATTTLACVLLMTRARAVAPAAPRMAGPSQQAVAGFASGFMGVTTGMSGPPVALESIYARRPVLRNRATLALFFLVIDTAAVLTHPDAIRGSAMIPLVAALLVGLLVGRRITTLVSEHAIRQSVAAVVAMSAVAAVVRQLS